MKAVLIKGMKMPKSCGDCEFHWEEDVSFDICHRCQITGQYINNLDVCSFPYDCPLSEVPESCEDAISREAAKWVVFCNRDHVEDQANAIDELPSVTPKQQWIPVTERLPEKPNVYTVTDSKGDVVRFVFTGTESSREYWLRCAKAWMPLPESYREEGEE